MSVSSASSSPEQIVNKLEEGQYIVEKILDRKIVEGGAVEYLIKWVGYENSDNSWEPEENLHPRLVRKFERKREEEEKAKKGVDGQEAAGKKTKTASASRKVDTSGGSEKKKKKSKARKNGDGFPPEEVYRTGLERGMEAEKIIGVTESTGGRMFLIKYKDVNQSELIPFQVANIHCPQLVISFYEVRLSWNTTPTVCDPNDVMGDERY